MTTSASDFKQLYIFHKCFVKKKKHFPNSYLAQALNIQVKQVAHYQI